MNTSCEENNDTMTFLDNSTDFQLNSLHEYLYGSIPSKIFYFLMVFIEHLLGPVLMSGIVIFEKYGGDPQKRNILNRLLSMALTNQIMFSLVFGLCKVWRGAFGLIDFSCHTTTDV